MFKFHNYPHNPPLSPASMLGRYGRQNKITNPVFTTTLNLGGRGVGGAVNFKFLLQLLRSNSR